MKQKSQQKKKYKRNVLDSLKIAKTPRVRKELLDADYLDKLSPEEKLWYAKFIDEYVGANIKKYKKPRKGEKVRRVKKGHLHRSQEHVKSIYDSNNWRNNDVHSVTRANHMLYNIETQNDGWYVTNVGLTEDALISMIDNRDSMPSLDAEESSVNNLNNGQDKTGDKGNSAK